jgi:3-dehydroquinate synthase
MHRRLDMPLSAKQQELGAFPTDYGWLVQADREVKYPVAFTSDLLETDAAYLRSIDPDLEARASSRHWLVFLDTAVQAEYGARIHAWLSRLNTDKLTVYPITLLESDKSLATIERIYGVIADADLSATDQIVVIGGGLLCDIAGFAAATWNRGTAVWMVPTTLVGLGDSGPAGKRSVNHFALRAKRKHGVGTVSAPECVLLSDTWLPTVPTEDLTGGAAEMVKVSVVADSQLFELLEHHGPAMIASSFRCGRDKIGVASEQSLRRTVHGTARYLALDYFERDKRRRLNHAHDFAGKLEMAGLDRIPHGHTVAMNLAWSATLSARRNKLPAGDRNRIFGTLTNMGIPITHPLLTTNLIVAGLEGIARTRGGPQHIPIVTRLGEEVEYVCDVSPQEAEDTHAELLDRATLYPVADADALRNAYALANASHG